MTEDKLHSYTDTKFGRVYHSLGIGPVSNSTEDNANQNIAQLVKDVGLEEITSKRDSSKDYSKGRYAYQLTRNERDVEVQMPGLPLEHVRFLGEENQDAWDFPRLYVDGNSWLWKYAINDVKNAFENPDEK